MPKLELLAPAGDLKKLKYAISYGADAVYCGLPQFSLRAKAGFTLADLKQGVDWAHEHGKKVYVTVNIFAHEAQMKKLPEFLKKIKAINPDALIISDPGILALVKKILPKIEIHLSTQANTLNSEAIKFWRDQGVKRIILGREATLKDLQDFKKKVRGIGLEVFVHGAMCMSYSGRCYLSAWLNNRSANQGLCTQPCRWDYKVYLEEGKRPGELIPIEEDDKGLYVLNSKDLCLIDYLGDLAKAGICSFKIEGRMKSVYYLATVIRAYRLALNSLAKNKKLDKKLLVELKKELLKVDSREYTTGFLLGSEGIGRQNFQSSKAQSAWQFAGEIVKTEGEKVFIKIHNVLKTGELVEVVTPKNIYKIKIIKLFNKKGEVISEAHGGTDEIYSFDSKENLGEWGVLRVNSKQ